MEPVAIQVSYPRRHHPIFRCSRDEQKEILARSLSRLRQEDPRVARAFVLYVLYELSLLEIGRVLRRDESTISRYVERGRARFRANLEEELVRMNSARPN
jgi:DNA-directed RNA polymerase specialized sigma24 family protein